MPSSRKIVIRRPPTPSPPPKNLDDQFSQKRKQHRQSIVPIPTQHVGFQSKESSVNSVGIIKRNALCSAIPGKYILFHLNIFHSGLKFLICYYYLCREKRQLENELQMYKKVAVQQRKDIVTSKAPTIILLNFFCP